VASKSEYSSMQANHYEIIDDTFYIGGTIIPLDTCFTNGIIPLYCPHPNPNRNTTEISLEFRHLVHGPFTRHDPTSIDGKYLADMTAIGTERMEQCAIAMVDKNTGIPMNLITLNGTSNCHIDSMDTGGIREGENGKVIVAGGHHAAGGQLIVNAVRKSDQIIITAHDYVDTAFVVLMEPNGDVRWLIQPWIDLIDGIYENATMAGSSVDANGDIYIGGYRTDFEVTKSVHSGKYAMISKHSGADGSIIWEKEFEGVQNGLHLVHDSSDASDGALYVTLEVPTSMEESGFPGITCKSTSSHVQACSVLARLSAADGSVHWARYAYGLSGDKSNYGDVKLAHPDDGPYVYAAFNGVGSFGPSSLDLGTSYSGCMADDGTVKLEIDSIFSHLTSPLNPTQCKAHNLGTYFRRASAHAVPANVVNSLAQCSAESHRSQQHCLAKYHTLTGLPVWGAVSPAIEDFEPLSDGIIMTGSKIGDMTFDTVTVSDWHSKHPIVYQSKIDLDGVGVYVQSIAAFEGASGASLTQDPVTGDVYIGFSTESSRTRLGPGQPVGFIQDLMMHQPAQRTTVAKLGREVTPHCIQSCGEDGKLKFIKKETCFIDNVCYQKGNTGARIGMPCGVCDPSKSQTGWTLQIDFCEIDGVCYNKGDLKAKRFDAAWWCKMCSPEKDPHAWSLRSGQEIEKGVCRIIQTSSAPTYLSTNDIDTDLTPGDEDLQYGDDTLTVGYDDYTLMVEDEDEDEDDDDDDYNPIGIAIPIIICAILFIGITLGIYTKNPRGMYQYGEQEFFPCEGDMT